MGAVDGAGTSAKLVGRRAVSGKRPRSVANHGATWAMLTLSVLRETSEVDRSTYRALAENPDLSTSSRGE